jgi:signal transduction histidine kinase
MEKLHHERDIAITLDVPEVARFRGEQHDLEETVGNLVDNACKWARSRSAPRRSGGYAPSWCCGVPLLLSIRNRDGLAGWTISGLENARNHRRSSTM